MNGGHSADIVVKLRVVAGPHRGRNIEFTAADRFLVGRGAKAHFRLPTKDQYFSRSHFLVEVNPPLCQLYDLQSTNGTFVNGQKVEECPLKSGDRISGGETEFVVEILGDLDQTWVKIQAGALPAGPPANLPPPLIPGFELGDVIGKGGMGTVYRAMKVTDGSTVAIKVIQPAIAGTGEDYERFLREVRILKDLEHQRIVRYLSAGEVRGALYLVMEYVPGENSRQRVKANGPLPIDQAVRLTGQFLPALQYAHDKGFVHRDVKPSNILLYQKNQRLHVKLADFGLARTYMTTHFSGCTQLGQIGGTIHFMPPEQVTNFREAMPASDQYSAAATLYWLLTGLPAYDFPKEVHRQLAVLMGNDPLPIRQRRPEVPRQLEEVLQRAMAREPEERYATITDFGTALMSAIE